MVQLAGSPLHFKSHTFTGLLLANRFLTTRGEVKTVAASTLFAALIDMATSPSSLHVEPSVHSVLASPFLYANHNVSTIRIPSFDPADMQNPLHGYRFLGPLHTFQMQPLAPEGYFDAAHDVLAIHASYGDTRTMHFENMWGPIGVNLQSHFMLIVCSPPPSAPAATDIFQLPLPDILDSLTAASDWNTPPLPSVSSTSLSMAPALSATETFLNSAAADASMEAVLDGCGITVQQIQSARFIGRLKSFCAMVKMHQSASNILQTLGLNSYDATQTDSSGLVVSAPAILVYLGWSSQTHQNKSRHYTSAARAAGQRWKESAPSKCSFIP